MTRTCRRCRAPIAAHQVCDSCADPETVRRRNGRTPEQRAEAVELSPFSARIDAAIRSLEAHAARALKLAIDADAGVTALATKRSRAVAAAGTRTGTPLETSR